VAETLVVNEIYVSLQGESTFAGLPCVFIRLTACNLRCSYCDTAYAFTEGRKQSFAEIRGRVHELARPYEGRGQGAGVRRQESGGRSQGSGVRRQEAGVGPNAGAGAAGLNKPSGIPIASSQSLTPDPCPLPPVSRLPVVEFTGGEPLLQPGTAALMRALCDDGFTVLVETSGALDISGLDPRVRRIMDLKCPSSGEVERNRWENLRHLRATDEVKFVIGTVEDYDWARSQVMAHDLAAVCPVLFSWVAPLSPEQQHPALRPVPAGQTPLTRLQLVERIIADAMPVRFQLQMHKVIWSPDQRGV